MSLDNNKAVADEGRRLADDNSQLTEMQRNRIKRAEERALADACKATGLRESAIRAAWDDTGKYSDTGPQIRKLSEAVSESSFPQLLRFGVQNFLFDGYASVPVIYPDLVRVVSSSGAEELYAPLYGAELPTTVQPGQEFGDSRLAGLDVHVPNTKKGRMLSIERELVDDDRTGQITTRAGQMGERMRYVEESDVMTAIASGGPQGYTTAIGNRPASYGQLSLAGIEAADIALQNMTDPLGNKMLVMPDTLLVSPVDKFNAAQLLNSTLQPSVPQNTTGAFNSGATGWTMAINPLQGLYALKVSRFMANVGQDATHGSWYVMETKKSLVFQDRDALEVLQEASNAGGAFERDVYRYRVRRRYAAALIESRYLYQGN